MIVSVTKKDGLKFRMLVPDDAPESTWEFGIPIGPPDLGDLGLPSSIEVRLNNELFNRGLITSRDVRKNGDSVFGALQAVLKVDTGRIVQLYLEQKLNA